MHRQGEQVVFFLGHIDIGLREQAKIALFHQANKVPQEPVFDFLDPRAAAKSQLGLARPAVEELKVAFEFLRNGVVFEVVDRFEQPAKIAKLRRFFALADHLQQRVHNPVLGHGYEALVLDQNSHRSLGVTHRLDPPPHDDASFYQGDGGNAEAKTKNRRRRPAAK